MPIAAAPIIPLTITKPMANQGSDALEKLTSSFGETIAFGRSDGPQSTSSALPPQSARADLVSHVARQIADVAHHLPARPVEITLSPEELGRVRLSMTTQETGIVLNVVAERPETMDLLRRHISQLGEQFQALGYENISFSFAGGGDAQDSEGGTSDSPAHHQPIADDTETAPLQIALATGASAGVDLRL